MSRSNDRSLRCTSGPHSRLDCYDKTSSRFFMLFRFSGAIFSSLSPAFIIGGAISFFGNHANFFGGAISLTDPTEVYITSSVFQFNTGTSGGAVSLLSAEPTAGGFEQCRFDRNNGSNGGAVYLTTENTIEIENARFVRGSVFLHNAAGESYWHMFHDVGVCRTSFSGTKCQLNMVAC